jgi:2EXR family
MTVDSIASESFDINPRPLQEFHLFPHLPIELRLQIWEKTVQPRMICIDDLSGDRGPAILRTCRDSRAVARPKYQDYRATRIQDNVRVGFLINPAIDVFEVCQFGDKNRNRWQIVALLNIVACRYPVWLSTAERLALYLSSETHAGYPNGFLEQRLLSKQFPDLKELFVILDSEKDVKLDELVDVREGSDKQGRVKEKFCTSLWKNQEEKGLLKSLKLSFMRLNVGDGACDPMGMEKSVSGRI